MDLFGEIVSSDCANSDKPSGSSSDSDSGSDDRITKLLRKKLSYEPPILPISGDSRYLDLLWVFGNGGPPYPSASSLSRITGVELRADIVPNPQEIHDKIRAALKLLSFREQHILVQFWLPFVVGRHRLLKTSDQPFGLGHIHERLCFYRRDSEQQLFIVDKDHEEDDLSPPARVFRRGFPEWTFDITNYMPNDFPQRASAIHCNLYGYLALPVFDSTGSIVGVLELLTSSKYMGYAFEVQQVHRVLKTVNLTAPQSFDDPASKVSNERRQKELDEIHVILKAVCGTHGLPFAQTWVVSPFSSYVSHEGVVKKSCSSFSTGCIGKVCMSTADLPFHVEDMGMWPFWESCRKQHLEKSQGCVGRTLLSRRSCFCGDVTKLSEEEYPLVHDARKSGLTSCIAVFLHSVAGDARDYVLEFFLPPSMKESRNMLNVVQTLKQEVTSTRFELGDMSSIQVVGLPTEVSYTYLNTQVDTSIQIRSTIMANVSLSEPMVANVGMTDNVNTSSYNATGSIQEDVTVAGEMSNRLKHGIKRKIDTLTLETVEEQYGKPLGEAAVILGVSRSTLKRFCREHDITRWPDTKRRSKRSANLTGSEVSQKPFLSLNIQESSSLSIDMYRVVILLVRVKRWICMSRRHGFSGKWWICGKHTSLPSKACCLNIYQVADLVLRLRRWRNRNSWAILQRQFQTRLRHDWGLNEEGLIEFFS